MWKAAGAAAAAVSASTVLLGSVGGWLGPYSEAAAAGLLGLFWVAAGHRLTVRKAMAPTAAYTIATAR